MKALVKISEMSDKNPFNRLPQEIIIYIFDKISDAKSLCICTLVSKKLSALVLQIQTKTISVEIPFWKPFLFGHQNSTAAVAAARLPPLLVKLLIYVVSLWWVLRKYIIYPSKKPNKSDITSNFMPVIKFLKRFSSIQSLTFHLSFHNNPSGSIEPLVRWKFKKSEFIFLSAESVCVYSSERGFENDEDDDDVLVEPSTHFDNLICYHLLDAVWRYKKILKPIISDFPNLKNVSVIDSLNQGKIVLDEDDISSLRNEDEPLMKDADDVKFRLKRWDENVVHLPLSGRVMKGVNVLMCKKIGINDGLMVSENGFEEEEELCELASTMVKKEASFEGVISLTQILSLAARDE